MFKEKVLKLVTNYLGSGHEVTLDTIVINASGIDAESNRDLIMRLEEELEVDIPDLEADKFRTVQDIVTYLDSTVKTKTQQKKEKE